MFQAGEDILGLLAGKSEIQSIRTQVHLFGPNQFTRFTDLYFHKIIIIIPQRKHTGTGYKGKQYPLLMSLIAGY